MGRFFAFMLAGSFVAFAVSGNPWTVISVVIAIIIASKLFGEGGGGGSGGCQGNKKRSKRC